MGDLSIKLLAAEGGGGGGNNFLVPNGTFFVVLIIFLIVLGVLATFVVPPIMRVLHEREAMVAKTAENNRQSDKHFAAAQSDYEKAMTTARREASGVRDEARAEGRRILDGMKGRASDEAAQALQKAHEELKQQADGIAGELRSSMEKLSTTLASRILGADVSPQSGVKGTASTSPGR